MTIIGIEDFVEVAFDYIIVGGGTAGLAVAARLSEDLDVTVGVIEAGESHLESPEVNTPGLYGTIMGHPKHDWSFLSTPQENLGNRAVFQPRGKGLGGSSSLNFMFDSRPSKANIDMLETLGNKGWNWDSLFPYFIRSETFVPSEDETLARERGIDINPEHHGIGGPVLKSLCPWISPIHYAMRAAYEELGIPNNSEPASGNNVGHETGIACIDPAIARRSSSASSYYSPNATRKNLFVVLNTLASKVIFEPSGGGLQRATGIVVLHGGKSFVVRGVRREIVVSAGTLQTPIILELSGVGNPTILEKHGIPTIIDLPGVGENLQDHPVSHIIFEIGSEYDSLDVLHDPALLARQHDLYKVRKGILASIPCQQCTFISMPSIEDPGTIKRWQTQIDCTASSSRALNKQYAAIREWLADPLEASVEIMSLPGHFFQPPPDPLPGKRYHTLVSSLMYPLSRGSIHISSADPAAPPIIDPKYLSHPLDLDILVSSLKFSLRALETAAMRSVKVAQVFPTNIGKCNEDLAQHVKNTLGSSFHPLGTAAMLPREDGGVVDAELRVYGTVNLRVIDCSILPMEISSHLQSVVYAIAERGADILRQAY